MPLKLFSRTCVEAWQCSAQTYRLFMVFIHTYNMCVLCRCLCCVQSWNVTLPCETAQICCSVDVSILTAADSTAGCFTREPNKIVFSLWLWRLICFSVLSPLTASLLHQHAHACTHALVERRHFVTRIRGCNDLGNQCDRTTEGLR